MPGWKGEQQVACGAPESPTVPAGCRELRGFRLRRLIGQRGIRPSDILVLSPQSVCIPYLVEGEEQRLVLRLFAHSAIEALHVAALRELTRDDVVTSIR